jgi:hypothetical protein
MLATFAALSALIGAACGPGDRTLEPRPGPAEIGGSIGTAPHGGAGGGAGADTGSGGMTGPSAACTVPGCGVGTDLPSGVNLGGVWIGSDREVWAVGGAFVGRRAPNTAQWCWCAPGPPSDILTDVWGAASDDVFAVGLDGLVLRFDGTRWIVDHPVPVGINGVHGSGPDNVWLAGPSGWTARFDGSAWQAAVIDAKYNLNAVWVAPDGVVRVAGNAPLPPGVPGESSNIEAVVLRHPRAGGDWTVEASFEQRGFASFYGLSGSSAADIWAVGNNIPSGAATSAIGFVSHFDGSSWSGVRTVPDILLEGSIVVDVAAATPDAGATWFLDAREGVRFDGTNWTTTAALANTGAIDARDGVMYAVGDAGLVMRWTPAAGWVVDRAATP